MYDEILEKTYYWNEDQDLSGKGRNYPIEASTPRPKPRKINKIKNKLPSLKTYEPRKPVSYKTPWTNMEDYAKQCKRSEKTATCK